MKLSTRSRYGLRMMYELALNYGSDPVIIKDIAHNQNISEKYLSKLIIPLKGAHLVNSSRGSHGGYILSRDPSEITLREILEVLEGGITPVDCSKDGSVCSKSSGCPARDVWCMLESAITGLLEGITLADMLKRNNGSASGVTYCGNKISEKKKNLKKDNAL
jgi:Rrf2 family protein